MNASPDKSRRRPLLKAFKTVIGNPWLWICIALFITLKIEPPLRQMRLRQLNHSTAITTGHPAWVQYVMVGLGGFRGIISEALWMRAARLQEQGRYFEQVQLADWITALDPRATEAWIFNSWNLAYNISAMMPRFEDRLTWVNAGISLLRDRAIPTNPNDARLYRELGWLYQNKIGDATDPANVLYKLNLVKNMTAVLEPAGQLPPTGSQAALRLQRDFHLDCKTMHALEAKLGKLDWRLPQSHAIYWAWCGLHKSQGFERQALRRMIHQNLIVLIERGRFTGDVEKGQFTTAPDLALIPTTTAFFVETVHLYPNESKIFARYLALAVRMQAQAGDQAGARKSYDHLRKLADKRHAVPAFETLAGPTELDDSFFAPIEPEKP